MGVIKLRSADGKFLETSRDVIKCSGTIMKLLEDHGSSETKEGGKDIIVPLIEVRAVILEKILEYAKYHKDDHFPDDESLGDDQKCAAEHISTWDSDFLNVDIKTLYGIMNAAECLQMNQLKRVSVKYVAKIIRNKGVAELAQLMGTG